MFLPHYDPSYYTDGPTRAIELLLLGAYFDVTATLSSSKRNVNARQNYLSISTQK